MKTIFRELKRHTTVPRRARISRRPEPTFGDLLARLTGASHRLQKARKRR